MMGDSGNQNSCVVQQIGINKYILKFFDESYSVNSNWIQSCARFWEVKSDCDRVVE
jgi:hypothetical protein